MDRFRDLEGAGKSGRKDASLLAAIAGFEALHHPTSLHRQQFSNLFLELFPHIRDETKRTAAAALSRLPVLPENVVAVIADQPVRIAAPFLAFSPCANDGILLRVIARYGVSHGRAISRRKALSKTVVAALIGLKDAAVMRSLKVRGAVTSDRDVAVGKESDLRHRNEEALRAQLKTLAFDQRAARTQHQTQDQADTLGKLLILRAQGRNPIGFADCLALALRSNTTLTDRIMLDISGHQLAMALQALNVAAIQAETVLQGVFPHLTRRSNGVSHARLLLDGCDAAESRRKVDAWRRANDDAEHPRPVLQPLTTDLPSRVAKLPSDRRITGMDRRGRAVKYRARRA